MVYSTEKKSPRNFGFVSQSDSYDRIPISTKSQRLAGNI